MVQTAEPASRSGLENSGLLDALALGGDSELQRLERLMSQHFSFVINVLYRAGVRDGDIDDLAQRVFLTALRKLNCIMPDKERAFLHTVAQREAGHARRSYQRRREVGDDGVVQETTPSVRPDELVLRKQALHSIATVIDAMDVELRSVFMLHELHEMPLPEISLKLRLPLGTVKTRLRRARAMLAERTRTMRR
jgi:RNA polymerase sigma-70 factor, ECF subfamily